MQGLSIALLTSFGGERRPVWVARDISGAVGSNWKTGMDALPVELEVFSVDVHPGVRKAWDSRRWRASVGAGPALHLVLSSVQSSEWSPLDTNWEIGAGSAIGFWLNGRSAVRFGPLQVGLDARLSRAKATLDFEEVHLDQVPGSSRELDFESGGQYLGLFVGLGW